MRRVIEDVLRQRVCRWHKCMSLFCICRRCDRGHQYCSDQCRQKARREQKRAANLRYRKTLEARLDQRDRQKAYRLRRAAVSVMDQGSTPTPSADIISPPALHSPVAAEKGGKQTHETIMIHDPGLRYCVVCGRTSWFVDPFYVRRKFP
jgi:hypothetical protein